MREREHVVVSWNLHSWKSIRLEIPSECGSINIRKTMSANARAAKSLLDLRESMEFRTLTFEHTLSSLLELRAQWDWGCFQKRRIVVEMERFYRSAIVRRRWRRASSDGPSDRATTSCCSSRKTSRGFRSIWCGFNPYALKKNLFEGQYGWDGYWIYTNLKEISAFAVRF